MQNAPLCRAKFRCSVSQSSIIAMTYRILHCVATAMMAVVYSTIRTVPLFFGSKGKEFIERIPLGIRRTIFIFLIISAIFLWIPANIVLCICNRISHSLIVFVAESFGLLLFVVLLLLAAIVLALWSKLRLAHRFRRWRSIRQGRGSK